MRTATSTKLSPWLILSACLLFLGFASTPYATFVDHLFVAVRFSGVVLLSIVAVRSQFASRTTGAETLLNRLNRWYCGETAPKRWPLL